MDVREKLVELLAEFYGVNPMYHEELANVLREFAAKPMQGSFLKWLKQPAK